MAGYRCTHATYAKLLEILRNTSEAAPSFATLARQTGLDWRTVSNLFYRGLPNNPKRNIPGLPALQDVLTGKVPNPFDPQPIPEASVQPQPVSEAPVQPQPVSEAPVQPQPVSENLSEASPTESVTAEIMPAKSADYVEHEELRRAGVATIRANLDAVQAVRNDALGIALLNGHVLAALKLKVERLAKDIQADIRDGVRQNPLEVIKELRQAAAGLKEASSVVKEMTEASHLALGGPTEIIRYVTEAAPVKGALDASQEAGPDNALLAALLSAQGSLGAELDRQATTIGVSVGQQPTQDTERKADGQDTSVSQDDDLDDDLSAIDA